MRDGLAAAWPAFYPGCRNARDVVCVECRHRPRVGVLLCQPCMADVVRSSAALVAEAVETRDRIAELRAARSMKWRRPIVKVEPPVQLTLEDA